MILGTWEGKSGYLSVVRCDYCGEYIQRYASRVNTDNYCNISCRENYKLSKLIRKCSFCGSNFKLKQGRLKFCSLECYQKSRNKHPGRQRVNKCPICNGLKNKYATICLECYHNRDKKPKSSLLIEKTCAFCKGWFVTEKKANRFCSDECKKKGHRLSHMDGRKRKYGRDGGFVKSDGVILHADSCKICGYDRFVEYHHVSVRQVVALCPNHHRLVHRNGLTKDEEAKLSSIEVQQGELFTVKVEAKA